MSDDLRLEMLGYACALTLPACELLAEVGVPRAVIAGLLAEGDLGLARCAIGRRHELWEPEGGERRLILAVRDDAGELIDLVAVSSSDPDSWALRTGAALLLGGGLLADARRDADADGAAVVRIFGTPIAWLRAACDGVCILDWSAAALGELRALGPAVTLAAEDGQAVRALTEQLRWAGLPKVESWAQARHTMQRRLRLRAAEEERLSAAEADAGAGTASWEDLMDREEAA